MPVARRLAEHLKLIFTALKSLKPQAGTVNHPFGDIGGILKPQPLPLSTPGLYQRPHCPAMRPSEALGGKAQRAPTHTHTHTSIHMCTPMCLELQSPQLSIPKCSQNGYKDG